MPMRKRAAAEVAAAMEKPVSDALQTLAADPPRPVAQAIVAAAADDFTPNAHDRDAGDITRLLAEKISRVYEEFGLTPPGTRGDILEELAITGEPVARPDGVLGREQERERQAKNRAEALAMLAAPSSKRRSMLLALQASPPFSFFCPEPMAFQVNTVNVEVDAGMVPAKLRRDDIDPGCVMVAEWVQERMAARGFELAERRRMRNQTIEDGDESERNAPRARTNRIW